MLQRAIRSIRVAAAQAGIDPPILLLDNGSPSSEAVRPKPDCACCAGRQCRLRRRP